ncbi:MAG: hypothetical protein ABJZ55_01970 [Fuerstiella sp.]
MIYIHNKTRQFSDRPTASQRRNFVSWDTRTGPAAAYAAHGWQQVTESLPVYDDSPLTGPKVRKLDAGGTTWSWYVGEVRWDQAIDTVAQARQQAEAAVAAVRSASIAAGIPIILPAGSTLDGVNAAGQTVRLHLSGHPIADYWDKVGQAVQLGTAAPTFDSLAGRCVVGNQYMLTICRIVASAKSQAFTATRDAERAIELGKYSDVLAMAQAFAAQGAPSAVDVAALSASS